MKQTLTFGLFAVIGMSCFACGGVIAEAVEASDAGDEKADVYRDGSRDRFVDQTADQVVDRTTDRTVDQATDQHDEGDMPTPLEPFGCVSDWPSYEIPKPVASLAGPTLTVKEPHQVDVLPIISSTPGPSVFWGERLGFGTLDNMVSYDPTTGDVKTRRNEIGLYYSTVYSSIRPDIPGAFVFAGSDLEGFVVDFATDHEKTWGVGLGTPLGPYDPVYRAMHQMLLDPQGRIYISAVDDIFRVVNARTGKVVKEFPFPVGPVERMLQPILGVGDRFFVDNGVSYSRNHFTAYGLPQYEGQDVTVAVATYSKQLLGFVDGSDASTRRLVALGPCGEPLWSLGSYPTKIYVGFDDSIIAETQTGEQIYSVSVYSKDGKHVAGPAKNVGRFLALGADGVSYYARCAGPDATSSSPLEVVALSASLNELQTVRIGGNCLVTDAVLLDDGMLLIPREQQEDRKAQIVRIATASPGPARTAWPMRQRDNHRSNWVSGW